MAATSEVLTTPGTLTPLAGGQMSLTVSSAAALTIPGGANVALIQALTQNVRWRDDGTAPTASVGLQLLAGDEMFYTGDLSAIQIIQEAATAEVNVLYYRSN